jgi:2-oxoglutarate ferredoxin oxidoreductase subunit beta
MLDDGSHVLLRKLDLEYDPTNDISALKTIHESRARGEFVTGLLYVETNAQDLCAREHLVKQPLAQLDEETLRIGREDWQRLMEPAAGPSK